MAFTQLTQIETCCKETGKAFWQVIQESDCQERDVTPEQSFSDMQGMYRAMEQADAAYDPALRSASGMAGGDGAKFSAYRLRENRLLGDYLTEVMERALKMAESNACMKRIVAAPTAGSCGVIPAVLLSYASCRQASEERLVEALYVAGGDCQEICHAAALALKSLLGLTCDPVAGLVEVPCIKRNASGAVNAVVASQMALSGIRSAIPPDEVIDSMRRIGHLLPACLRETGQDGLATTPTGLRIAQQMTQQ